MLELLAAIVSLALVFLILSLVARQEGAIERQERDREIAEAVDLLYRQRLLDDDASHCVAGGASAVKDDHRVRGENGT